MADVKFACPGCQLHIKVGLEYVGMASTCPECQQQFKIPAPPGEVKFACGGCQLRLALHESYIGSQIACPGCNAQVIVPNPAAPAAAKPKAVPAKPAPVPAKPKAVTAVDRVSAPTAARPSTAPRAASTASAPKAKGPMTRPPNIGAPPNVSAPRSMPPAGPAAVAGACPSCRAAMAADAIICTSCGYNAETGKAMESAMVSAQPPPPPGSKKRKKKGKVNTGSKQDVRIREDNVQHERSLRGAAALFLFAGGLYFVVGLTMMFADFKPRDLEEGINPQGIRAVGFIVGALGFLILVVGIGVRTLRPWSRIPFIVLNVLNLLSFPVGTFISCYCIYLSAGVTGNYILSDEYREIVKRTPGVKAKTSIFVWIVLFLIVGGVALAIVTFASK